jgi:hypothetical protein
MDMLNQKQGGTTCGRWPKHTRSSTVVGCGLRPPRETEATAAHAILCRWPLCRDTPPSPAWRCFRFLCTTTGRVCRAEEAPSKVGSGVFGGHGVDTAAPTTTLLFLLRQRFSCRPAAPGGMRMPIAAMRSATLPGAALLFPFPTVLTSSTLLFCSEKAGATQSPQLHLNPCQA